MKDAVDLLNERIAELEADNEALRHDNARYAETTSELADEIERLREALKNAAVACRNLEHDERFTAESIAKGCEKALGASDE